MWIPFRVTQRVMSRIDFEGDCWISQYSTGSHGYAQVGWWAGGKNVMTLCHRVAFLAVNGEIPDDKVVDHICHNRRCVNPEHLRLLTNVENATDNGYSTKTHCPAEHPYEGDNLYVDPNGHRRCRACAKANFRAWDAVRRAS